MNLMTKRAICLLVGIASVLTIIGTVSYAYFTALGETQTQEATINTGTARVRFADGNNGITKELSFGESVEKIFTIENTGTVESTVKMYWKDLVNTYLSESLTYTLSQSETEDGPFTEVMGKKSVPKKDTNLSDLITIPVGKTYYFKLIITLNYLSDINQDQDITARFSSSFDLKDVNDLNTIEKIIASSNGVKSNFDEPALTDEGIFEMEDDYGTSYYYRGAVENNYVKYGVNAAGQEMWWRIIRVNGDGSLRIVYDGTQGYVNGTNNNERFAKIGQKYNANSNDSKNVGWMYGPAGTTASTSKDQAQSNIESSDAKVYVDQWYKENIVDTGYGNNISDNIFCNDRSTPGKELTGLSSDTELGFGNYETAYGTYARMKIGFSDSGLKPSFKCPQKNDSFTVNDTEKGNGALTYPVGLITADEIVTSGSGKYGTSNSKYYLYKGGYLQWSLSSFYYSSSAYVFEVDIGGNLSRTTSSHPWGAIAPIINLSSEYVSSMVGTGTITDPYRGSEA